MQPLGTPAWLSVIAPIGTASLQPLLPASDALAWHVTVSFKRWQPPPGESKPPWNVTYGKTLITSSGADWTVAELELVRRFRSNGWKAGWVDTFGAAPIAWADRIITAASLPPMLTDWYRLVTVKVGSSAGGQPDVIAWNGETLADTAFVEYKGPSDRVRPGQEAWYREALVAGMSRDQYAVVHWPRNLAR